MDTRGPGIHGSCHHTERTSVRPDSGVVTRCARIQRWRFNVPGAGAARGPGRLGKLLIVFQVALSVLLVLAAALFGQSRAESPGRSARLQRHQSARNAVNEPPRSLHGMDPDGLLPGIVPAAVERAGSPVSLPPRPSVRLSRPFSRIKLLRGDEVTMPVQSFRVGPDYFRTLRIPVMNGREFTLQDRPGSPTGRRGERKPGAPSVP